MADQQISVGRQLHYFPLNFQHGPHFAHSLAPHAATVAYVHSQSMVNISILDHNGVQHWRTSVEVMPDGHAPEMRPDSGYCAWPSR